MDQTVLIFLSLTASETAKENQFWGAIYFFSEAMSWGIGGFSFYGCSPSVGSMKYQCNVCNVHIENHKSRKKYWYMYQSQTVSKQETCKYIIYYRFMDFFAGSFHTSAIQ